MPEQMRVEVRAGIKAGRIPHCVRGSGSNAMYLYSICPVCGEEHQIDIEDLAKNKLLTSPWFEDSPRVCCWPCTVQIKKEGLDAVMERRKESLAYELKQQSDE